MNIVFMGTPDFAVPTLQEIINSGHTVSGVFTQPDKKKGRGHHVLPPPIKELALKHNIAVFQPNSLRTDEAYSQVKSLSPDLIVVVAYGKMLPKSILDIPQHGCINVHASLLPKYRGAGPIQWSVLNGERETGVTTMYMAEGMDTGDMLLANSTSIGENETASELHDRLSVMGATLLIKTLDAVVSNTLSPVKQDDSQASHAPMLSKEMSAIDLTMPACKLHHLICGLSEWPCASITLNGKRLKIYKSKIRTDFDNHNAGELISTKDFVIACGDATAIQLVEVQYEDSKRMNGSDFLRGQRFTSGMNLI